MPSSWILCKKPDFFHPILPDFLSIPWVDHPSWNPPTSNNLLGDYIHMPCDCWYIYIYIITHIHIYTYRERERATIMMTTIYIYIYIMIMIIIRINVDNIVCYNNNHHHHHNDGTVTNNNKSMYTWFAILVPHRSSHGLPKALPLSHDSVRSQVNGHHDLPRSWLPSGKRLHSYWKSPCY